ncbi:MAG TPA: hypothetical protein VJ801_15225 [Polyangia bacterium]|jgi:hypothetical protein|nr:hypothetical protein [Polyangia bacterium]
MPSTGANPTLSPLVPADGDSSARLQFLLAISGVCIFIAVIGWVSDLRGALHGMLLVMSVAAFFPLLVVLAGILLFVALSLIAVVAGDSDASPSAVEAHAMGEGLVVLGKRLLVPYYRFLFTRRSPLFLGAVSGLLLGTILLWVLLALIVLPGELCSLKRLTAMQDAVDHYYKLHGNYPVPVQGKWLDRRVLSGEEPDWPACQAASVETDGSDVILLDGFGRRIHYQVAGHWRLASYRLTSLGYDGREGKDDICLAGATRARAALDRVADTADSLHRLLGSFSGKPSLQHWSAALRRATCPPDSRASQ